MKTTQFNNQLSKYFAEFLPQIRQCSPKTIESYSDSFISLFSFFDEKKGIKFNNVDYKDINPKNLDDYILYLRKEKGNSNSTIGVRISALASFLKYSSKRDMKALSALNSVINLKLPARTNKEIAYFTKEEMSLLLRIPDIRKDVGFRNRALLSFLYDSGARAQEICDICIKDVVSLNGRNPKARLKGKGNKIREVPVSPEVANLLRHYLNDRKASSFDEPLFLSTSKDKMTTKLISHLVDKTVKEAKEERPDLFACNKYSPHSFRHSKAVHLLEAGVPLIYIRNFLGHESIQTTEIYAKVTQGNLNRILSEKKANISIPAEEKPQKVNKFPDFLADIK